LDKEEKIEDEWAKKKRMSRRRRGRRRRTQDPKVGR
jgi:hypothetical protein